MTTIRSWLSAALTASWTESYSQRFANFSFFSVSFFAFFFVSFFSGWLGRSCQPFFASLIESASASRLFLPLLPLHATWSSLLPFAFSAEPSDWASGTSPPTEIPSTVSARGSGQYEGRSR